jgi:DNA-binding response OmpR family regulator
MPTLLIIDDNQSVRHTLKHIFTRAGYTVIDAENGAAGLALFGEKGADAALVDINMPGLNGVEVCTLLCVQARETGRCLPVWLMTGAPGVDVERLGVDAGAIEVLHKPFDVPKLMRDLAERVKLGADRPV